ncbi:hypothetical protein ACFSJ3_17090 [Corallincola platygyrae]|uniref:Uncharacterized protein n=1 Tax=Corallincola platygyrae TaxID=1193278 RepID=A0ABW4XTU3_9GAMM
MSDAKWVKLLSNLSEIAEDNLKTTVKLVWDKSPRSIRIDSDIQFGFDYYISSMESMISGYPKGFYDYRELEWIEVSASSAVLEHIEAKLKSLGQFETEFREKSIRIYGYK